MGVPTSHRAIAAAVIAAALATGCSTSPQVWTGPNHTVTAYPGSGHCDLDAVLFLKIDGHQYVFDPGTTVERNLLTGEPEKHANLPAGATDTGLRRGKASLWRAADGNAVDVVAGDSGEAGEPAQLWPRAVEPIGCD